MFVDFGVVRVAMFVSPGLQASICKGKLFEKVLSKTFRETIPRSELVNFRKFDRQNFTVTAEFISTMNKCT